MNIFYLDNNPEICAKYHVDTHVVKMILEYSQLLSTAHRVLDGTEYVDTSSGRAIKRWKIVNEKQEDLLYKATHINHPSAIWVRKSVGNYIWLHRLLTELCKEYTYRYGKVHKCESSGLVKALYFPPGNLHTYNFTEPTPAMPEEYITKADSIVSYREYYRKAKKDLWSWKGREIPPFLIKDYCNLTKECAHA